MQPLTSIRADNGDYARFILWPTRETDERGHPVAAVQQHQGEARWATVTFSLRDATDQSRLDEIKREIEENQALQEFFDEHEIDEWQLLPMNSRSAFLAVVP